MTINKRITLLAMVLALFSLSAGAQFTQKKYQKQVNKIQQEQHRLSLSWEALDDNDSIGKMRINDRMHVLNDQLYQLRREYIKTFPSDETTARILLNHYHEYDFLAGYDLLSPEVKNGVLRDSLENLRRELLRVRQTRANQQRLTEGATVPDFRLPSIKGDTVSLYSLLKQQPVVLDFWGTWCYWCMKGLPEMRNSYQKYWEKVEFVGIDCMDKEEMWRDAVEKENMVWTQLRNGMEDNDVATLLGVEGYPTKIIISQDGHILKRFVGESEDFYNALDSLFAPHLPEYYDKDSITQYLSYKLPSDNLPTHDDYVNAMTAAIDKYITNEVWQQRYRCDFTIDLIEMIGTVENPLSILDSYIETSPPDSLAARVRKACSQIMSDYGKTYPGEYAPDFTFTDMGGKRLSLKSLLGKTLLIDIWGTWCVPCIEEMPYLEKLQQKYSQREDIHIMSIACDKKADKWKTFLEKKPTSWHQYLITPEGDKVLNNVYHVMGIPRFIIIDKLGRIVSAEAQRPSFDTFNEYFDNIVNNQ